RAAGGRAHALLLRRGREQREARVPGRRRARARHGGSPDGALPRGARGRPLEDARLAGERRGPGAQGARAGAGTLAPPRQGRGEERRPGQALDRGRGLRGAARRDLRGRRLRARAGPGRAHTPAHGEVWMKIALTTAALLAFAAAAAAAAEPLRPLPGTVPRALSAMTPAGRAPAVLRLEHVTVFLGLRHRRALEAL